MRTECPFQPEDLDELGQLLAEASGVVPMSEIADGNHDPTVIGLRHDVDNFIEPAVQMARWEAARGYRSTYFILPTAPYWQNKTLLRNSVLEIGRLGHEIGYHLNAITEAIRTGRDPFEIVGETVAELRSYGFQVRGVVAHGDMACYRHRFINDELWLESPRPDYGAPDREVAGVKLHPISRTFFGFDYDPNWLPRAEYLSDSGGRWSRPFEDVAAGFPYDGQLHLLQHLCWWREALDRDRVAA